MVYMFCTIHQPHQSWEPLLHVTVKLISSLLPWAHKRMLQTLKYQIKGKCTESSKQHELNWCIRESCITKSCSATQINFIRFPPFCWNYITVIKKPLSSARRIPLHSMVRLEPQIPSIMRSRNIRCNDCNEQKKSVPLWFVATLPISSSSSNLNISTGNK
jgi:hypothetical protein